MFYLYGEAECLRTLLLLTAKNGVMARGASQLREHYFDFVTAIGGPELRPQFSAEQITYDDDRIKKLMAKHTDFAAPNDLAVGALETPLAVRQEAMAVVTKAIEHLGAVNAGLRRVFDLVIHTIFFHRASHSGGGSISSAPGVIWCSHRRKWSTIDIAEFLVHELTHNMLFLDERRYEHYTDPQLLADPETYAVSTVLRRPRPLDRTFHSLVVACEVLSFREENGEPATPLVHPSTQDLLRACRSTIEGIRAVLARRPVASERFLEVLERVDERTKIMSVAASRKIAPATMLASVPHFSADASQRQTGG
jgi:hypothetical protein